VPTIGGNISSGKPIMVSKILSIHSNVFSQVGGAFNQVEKPRFWGCSNFGQPLNGDEIILTSFTHSFSQIDQIS